MVQDYNSVAAKTVGLKAVSSVVGMGACCLIIITGFPG